MNLILLFKDDFDGTTNLVRLKGRRFEHIRNIHRAKTGDRLCVGLCDGKIGTGTVTEIHNDSVTFSVTLNESAPKPLKVTLILALPRPGMCKRILATAASMGVKHVVLFHSKRVEKSFWKSPVLKDDKIREQLILGLEQAKDTIMPKVELRRRFKPFVEDELGLISKNTVKLVAHPGSKRSCPKSKTKPVTLVVGPEGGLIPYEIDKLKELGFTPIRLGQRILRVEPAVTALLSQLTN